MLTYVADLRELVCIVIIITLCILGHRSHPPLIKLQPPLIDPIHPFPRSQVLKRVADRGELVAVALNTHGTRAVQKLIETLSSREQRQIVIEALRNGVWLVMVVSHDV